MPKLDRVARACSFASLALAVAVVLSACPGAAGEYVISQKKRKFTPAVVVAKIGDKVVFLNDDRFAHNIFSETPGHQFNVRKQMPGDRYAITLDTKGTFRVRCAIHPRMRMKITVE